MLFIRNICYSPKERMDRSMPDNISSLFDKIPIEILAPALAMITSIVRILYGSDKNSMRIGRVTLETITCGFLGLAAYFGVNACDIENDDLVIFISLCIGNLGSSSVRSIGMGILKRQINKDKSD